MEQRELKFKVWDKEKKRMSKPIGVGANFLVWNDGDVDMPALFAEAKSDRFIFLQYTGLKDKNGNKAYVGNIYKETKLDGSEYFYRIFYVEGGFGINTHHEDFKLKNIIFYEALSDMQTASWFKDNLEEIGNIYENPELISK